MSFGGVLGAGSDLTNLAGGMVDLFTRKKRREEQFAREDSAVQRRAADLEAAGLSKTLAAGSAASSAPISNRSTQTSVGSYQAAKSAEQTMLTQKKQIAQTDAQIKYIQMQQDKLGLDTMERAYNFGKAYDAGIRSDINGTTTQIIQALDALAKTFGLNNSTRGALGDVVPTLQQAADTPPPDNPISLKNNPERQTIRERREGQMEASNEWARNINQKIEDFFGRIFSRRDK